MSKSDAMRLSRKILETNKRLNRTYMECHRARCIENVASLARLEGYLAGLLYAMNIVSDNVSRDFATEAEKTIYKRLSGVEDGK